MPFKQKLSLLEKPRIFESLPDRKWRPQNFTTFYFALRLVLLKKITGIPKHRIGASSTLIRITAYYQIKLEGTNFEKLDWRPEPKVCKTGAEIHMFSIEIFLNFILNGKLALATAKVQEKLQRQAAIVLDVSGSHWKKDSAMDYVFYISSFSRNVQTRDCLTKFNY